MMRHIDNGRRERDDDDDNLIDTNCDLRCKLIASFSIASFVICVLGPFGYFMVYPLFRGEKGWFSVQIDSMRVSSLTMDMDANIIGNNYMTADFNVTLTATNNKSLNVLFESLVVSADYRGQFLSSTALEPFYQERGSHKTIGIWMGLKAVRVSQLTADGITTDLASQERALVFDINIRGHYWFLQQEYKYKCFMKLACPGVKVEFSSLYNDDNTTRITGATGSTTSGPIPCKFTSPCD